jgi:predicted AAA+ superfamily ATPase
MFKRSIKLSKTNSFFLFGARGTGKTRLLGERFSADTDESFNLLDPDLFQELSLHPSTFENRLRRLPKSTRWILIDEVQKVPLLLDIVHKEIERGRFLFAMTGSSARKLKRGAANLLAGRAFVYHLFPLTSRELGDRFDLSDALRWGTLPKIYSHKSNNDKRDYLRGYTHTYLQEEITQEQIIRKLDPFRRFLAVAAQTSGQIVNFSKIARDCGSTTASVMSYFQILEDTLIGAILEPFHESIRKRQRENPKFYFFDTGVLRALQNTLTRSVDPGTYEYGALFEHFIIGEIFRLSEYARNDYRFTYLRTQDGAEIDLIIERPGRTRALIEVKSASRITPEDIRSLKRLRPDIPNSEAFCFSMDPYPQILDGVHCLPWAQGLKEIGL